MSGVFRIRKSPTFKQLNVEGFVSFFPPSNRTGGRHPQTPVRLFLCRLATLSTTSLNGSEMPARRSRKTSTTRPAIARRRSSWSIKPLPKSEPASPPLVWPSVRCESPVRSRFDLRRDRRRLLDVRNLHDASLGLGVPRILHHRHEQFFLIIAEGYVRCAITGRDFKDVEELSFAR